MRTIKFRAFDDGEIVNQTGALTDISRFFRVIRQDAIIMQFTGIHDRNGKEVFEGDVVRFYNKYSKLHYTRVVRYCPMFACFGLYPNMEEVWEYESDWLKITEIEVIGNIHENPELL